MTGRELARRLDACDSRGCQWMRAVVAELLKMGEQDRILLRAELDAALGGTPEHLRGLWTAWCMTVGTMPGMPEYENALSGVLSGCARPDKPTRAYMGRHVADACGLKNY